MKHFLFLHILNHIFIPLQLHLYIISLRPSELKLSHPQTYIYLKKFSYTLKTCIDFNNFIPSNHLLHTWELITENSHCKCSFSGKTHSKSVYLLIWCILARHLPFLNSTRNNSRNNKAWILHRKLVNKVTVALVNNLTAEHSYTKKLLLTYQSIPSKNWEW